MMMSPDTSDHARRYVIILAWYVKLASCAASFARLFTDVRGVSAALAPVEPLIAIRSPQARATVTPPSRVIAHLASGGVFTENSSS